MTDVPEILANLSKQPPASEDLIHDLQAALEFELPEDYVAFMRLSNGAEGDVGEGYVQLWPLDKLLERNELYAVDEFAPGLVLFGSDGGDTAYAFMPNDSGVAFVDVPFIGMSRDETTVLGGSFAEFITSVAAQ